MKKLIIFIIKIYQAVFSASFGFGKCRFIPTCSCYAISAIEKKGLIYGGYLSLKRICRCHPFYKKNHNIYDPVD
jgi:putative membrane protein insertion efficiency factor